MNPIASTLITKLKTMGWESDRWGHLQKVVRVKRKGVNLWSKRDFRIKFSKLCCRVEAKTIIPATKFGPKRSEWVRVGGGYLKDCKVLPDGRVKLGTMLWGRQTADSEVGD